MKKFFTRSISYLASAVATYVGVTNFSQNTQFSMASTESSDAKDSEIIAKTEAKAYHEEGTHVDLGHIAALASHIDHTIQAEQGFNGGLPGRT